MNNLTATAQFIPYNPQIAKGFYYRELFENWDRGIRLMVDECKAVGLREPQIVSSEYLVTTTFFRNDVNELLQDKLPDKLLFLLVKDGSITIDGLSKVLKVSEKTVRIYLKQLMEERKIVRIGARKNGYWKVVEKEAGI